MRLIDADKIIQWYSETHIASAERLSNLLFLQEIVKNMPTVKAQPVIHAHWEYVKPYDDCGDVYSCTNCGYQDVFASVCEVPYCWHCGAKMEEVKK